MVFRRRIPRTPMARLRQLIYPVGGFRRAGLYLWHRLRRLPDPPHRIARGLFAGVFVSFTPFFGLHFLLAALLALIMRGNVAAALLATAVGNPITFPVIAVTSVELGNILLKTGVEGVPASHILPVFAYAGAEVWENFYAIFTSEKTHWQRLSHFYHGLFLPYLVGGIPPGIVAATAAYYLSLPLIQTYQRFKTRRRAKGARQQGDAQESAAPPVSEDAP